MTRGDTRQIAGLVAVVLALGLLLTACGDSDSDSASTPQTSTAPESGSTDSDGAGETSKPQESDGANGAAKESGDSGEEAVATPLEVSGGGSEQFRFKGGDNSIQEYGDESDESELQEAAEAVHGFYVARAEEDWNKACSYLAQSIVSQLEGLAAQSPELKSMGCGPLLKAFTRPLPPSVRRQTTVVNAGSFRREDERGFLIYYDAEDKPFAMPLEDEDGTWKLTLMSATPLG